MKFRLRPIFKGISFTFVTHAALLVGFIFIYQLIAKYFGPVGVGKYALIKRVIALFTPVLFLGKGIGLPRHIAMSKDKSQRSCYVKAGVTVVISFTLLVLLAINLFKQHFAKVFFGNINYTSLVLPFSFLLAGMTLHSLVYFYFQGRLFIRAFNILQLLNFVIAPLGILVFIRNIISL